MARQKNFEIIRRLATATQMTQAPQLQVNADQDSSRNSGALLSSVGASLGDAALIADKNISEKRAATEAQDLADGQRARELQDLTGKIAKEDPRYLASAKWKEGVDNAEGIFKSKDTERKLVVEIAQLEPDADIDAFLQERFQAILEDPANSAPETQKTLITSFTRIKSNLVNKHLDDGLKEMAQRQEDAITEVAVSGIQDKTLLTPEGFTTYLNYLNDPKFGYLDKRSATQIFAKALADEMANGNIDPEQAMAFAEAPRPDGTPGMGMSEENRDMLQNAYQAGTNIREKARQEALQKMEADAVFEMDAMAARGQLSNGQIRAFAQRFGKDDDPGFMSKWLNANQAGQKAIAEAAEKARKEREEAAELYQYGAEFMKTTDIQKRLDAALKKVPMWGEDGVTPSKEFDSIIKKARQLGVPIQAVVNLLQRPSPQDAVGWKRATELYGHLYKLDPTYAAKYGDAKSLALLRGQKVLMESGQTYEQARVVVANAQYNPSVGQAVIGTAWTKGKKTLDKTHGGLSLKNQDVYQLMIKEKATIYASSGLFGGDEAIAMAQEDFEAEFAVINGRMVPRRGMPKNAEPSIEHLLKEIKTDAVKSGTYGANEEFTVMPHPNDHEVWSVYDRGGRAVLDEKGIPINFSPGMIAQAHAKWKSAQKQGEILIRQLYKQNGNQYVEGKSHPERIAQGEANIAHYTKLANDAEKNGNKQLAMDYRRRASTQQKNTESLRALKLPEAVSQDFATFLNSQSK